MNYKYIYLAITILIAIVGLRVGSYYQYVKTEYCDGCQVRGSKVFWVVPRVGSINVYWRSGQVLYLCDKQICEQEVLNALGYKYLYTGVVSIDADEHGREQIIVEIDRIALDDAFATNWGQYLSGFLSAVMEARQYIVDVYKSYFSDPYLSLLNGIVLGVGGDFDQNLYQSLIRTGTIHVVAASGFNITIISKLAFFTTLALFSRKQALLSAAILVIFYTILAGSSPAVVRAAMMGIIAFGAQALGREYLAKWGLIITSLLMLLASPSLLWDVSFQLSVAATAGILWGVMPIQRLWQKDVLKTQHRAEGVEKEKEKFPEIMLGNDLAATIAAALATLPIIMIVFGRVSLVSPIVNMIVLWMVPPIMAMGGIILGAGLIWSGLGMVASWLLWPMLLTFVWVVETFARLPYASVELAGVPWVLGVGWWMLLVAWWARSARHHPA